MSRHFGGLGPTRQADRAKVFVVAAVLVITVSAALAFIFISAGQSTNTNVAVVRESSDPVVKMVDVLVPVQQLDQGVELQPAMFRVESRPEIGVPARAVRSFEEIKNTFARTIITQGQPLVRDLITDVRPVSVISGKIPEGYRAVTINVNATTSVEGWARPGARVDVVWVSKIRGENTATVIVQNAEVLSAERNVQANQAPGAPVPTTITLLVTAEDAAKINLANTSGSITLTLRGDKDDSGVRSRITKLTELANDGSDRSAFPDCEGTVKIGNTEFCMKPGGKLEAKR